MKKNGIMNSVISEVISNMGHTDQITIGDMGLPCPTNVSKIDLVLKKGVPTFIDVLDVVLEDLFIEKIILAEEIKTKNKNVHDEILKRIDSSIEVLYISHEEFKKQTNNSKAIIRTGEITPYANIILQSKVCF